METALENLLTRRSVRSYQKKEVPEDLLQKITKAGEYAPSGMGRQPCVMVVVRDKELLEKISQMNQAVMGGEGDPFYGAPAVIIVFADKRSGTYLYDGALTMGNLLNAAHAVGVDSCWIHRAKEVFETPEGKELKASWGLDENYEGIGNCILGYREGELPAPAPRKDKFVIWK